MRRRWMAGLATLGVGATGCGLLARASERSGVTDAERARPLPGDDFVTRPHLVSDRAVTLPGSAATVWPWLVQLGKHRGGWYLPRLVEEVCIPASRRAARSVVADLQHLEVGDTIPDWGPGTPVFRVAALDPPRLLVYHSRRQRSAGWTWPATEGLPVTDVLELSWAMVLDDVAGDTCRLHMRIRMTQLGRRLPGVMKIVGGLVDYVTVTLLFRGLRQRVAEPPSA